jgi:dephospho-CoA kinase
MRVIGLTGGIASGKSTVARMLRDLGAEVLDADQVARDVVAPGQPALDEIVRAFGREILDDSGALDRKKLGAIVFADPDKRRTLNGITHPRIGAATALKLQALRERGLPVAIYEAALIVENKMHLGLDGLIVTSVDEPTQLERTVKRDGLSADEAWARLRAQAPLADKLAAATWVVDTGGSLEETRARVRGLWDQIRSSGNGRDTQ